MLTGLRRTAFPVLDSHRCWIGRIGERVQSPEWASVVESYPISFHDWLYDHIGENSGRGEIACILIDVDSSLRYTRSFPKTFDGLLQVAEADEEQRVSREQLLELREQWRGEIERCMRRPFHPDLQG